MKRALSLSALTATLTCPALADPAVGFDSFDVSADHRSGLIAAGIWSPAPIPTYITRIGNDLVFEGLDAYMAPALPDGPLPLIIISHGSGSSMIGTAWLASGLAEQGALVAVMNHPGTTSGDSSPRRTVRLAERAADVSAVLDHLLADPYFATRIDADRISALGFSLGGSTVLGLAGLRLDAEAYGAYCTEQGDAAQDCRFLARGGVDFDTLPPEFSADMGDPRFGRVIAVDPGFTYAAVPSSAAEVDIPVQIVSLGQDFPWPTTDVRSEGSGLIDMLPQVEHAIIPDAHHFSFLPICTEMAPQLLIEEGEDPICDDPEGSDRATVHAASLAAIAAFLDL
ncbi:hypothetical protein V8J82_01475 [Gymnodinialimonas sp. 2305UL16-5]|uniref:alpha/beta hydrolase family protein n=1 Tax=Gymnodinialimonas mytili TaxID=3126503 RepID=UPI00309AC521